MTRVKSVEPVLFSAAPDPRTYQPIGSIHACREQLEATLRHDAGLGILVGPSGIGKSLLCQCLADSLRRQFDVVLLAESAPRDQQSLLQNILFRLNMPYRNLSEGELRLSLIDRLTLGAQSRGSGLVLIVDEAQTFPDVVLEEIRMISNIVRNGRSCVRTLLAGNHELEDRLNQPQMESLNQRIATRCYLHAFNQTETTQYIQATLASHTPELRIDNAAAAAVHFASRGVPRLIQQLMREALRCDPDEVIDAHLINDAWSKSRQLPSPMLEPQLRDPASVANSSNTQDIVEFGPLTVEDEQPDHERAEVLDTVAAKTNADLEGVSQSLLKLAEEPAEEAGTDATNIDRSLPRNACEAELADTDTTDSADSLLLASTSSCEILPVESCESWDIEVRPAALSDAIVEELTDCNLPAASDDRYPDADSLAIAQEMAHGVDPNGFFGEGFEEEFDLPTVGSLKPKVVDFYESNEPDAIELTLHREVNDLRAAAGTVREEKQSNVDGDAPAATVTDGLAFHAPHEEGNSDIHFRDDADLLIVEENIDVQLPPVGPTVFDDDPSDSADYQRLLKRLRQG